ncbi:MAG TPA: hypothetical protein VK308_02710 [Pyrinomonadaceae bacterium]|nr:hypothetical protein [Pyrinomonadaceae bacterium]
MKMKNRLVEIFAGCLVILISVSATAAQKRKPVNSKSKPVIFAVLNDGKMLEPIAYIDKGKLTAAIGGDSDAKDLASFTKSYYAPKTTYQMIFGGADAGTVSVKSFDIKAECAKHTAQIAWQSPKAKLRGMVMALATNALVNKKALGLRRIPTAAERSEIEALVRAEFTKGKISANNLKNLRSHNLTALDVDNDGQAELVGTYWIETSATTRALLFFIADQNKNGKYALGHSEFKTVKQDDVMSGEIQALDNGVYHELLLDVFDYDGDGTGEIFTYVQSFEGAGFNAYRRASGKWTQSFETSNYHCAF